MSSRRCRRDRQPQASVRDPLDLILISRLMPRGARDSRMAGSEILSRSRSSKSPAYHNIPSAPTNLTLHQAIDTKVPIGCGDAPVFPGDIIMGDAQGVVVILADRR